MRAILQEAQAKTILKLNHINHTSESNITKTANSQTTHIQMQPKFTKIVRLSLTYTSIRQRILCLIFKLQCTRILKQFAVYDSDIPVTLK